MPCTWIILKCVPENASKLTNYSNTSTITNCNQIKTVSFSYYHKRKCILAKQYNCETGHLMVTIILHFQRRYQRFLFTNQWKVCHLGYIVISSFLMHCLSIEHLLSTVQANIHSYGMLGQTQHMPPVLYLQHKSPCIVSLKYLSKSNDKIKSIYYNL